MMGVPCIYINLLEGKSIGTRRIHSEYLPGHEREVHSSPKWTGVFELGEFPSVQVISGVMMASSLNPHNILYIYQSNPCLDTRWPHAPKYRLKLSSLPPATMSHCHQHESIGCFLISYLFQHHCYHSI